MNREREAEREKVPSCLSLPRWIHLSAPRRHRPPHPRMARDSSPVKRVSSPKKITKKKKEQEDAIRRRKIKLAEKIKKKLNKQRNKQVARKGSSQPACSSVCLV